MIITIILQLENIAVATTIYYLLFCFSGSSYSCRAAKGHTGGGAGAGIDGGGVGDGDRDDDGDRDRDAAELNGEGGGDGLA